jgi:hypothetical protein
LTGIATRTASASRPSPTSKRNDALSAALRVATNGKRTSAPLEAASVALRSDWPRNVTPVACALTVTLACAPSRRLIAAPAVNVSPGRTKRGSA